MSLITRISMQTLKELRDKYDNSDTFIICEVLDISDEDMDELSTYRPYVRNRRDAVSEFKTMLLPGDALAVSEEFADADLIKQIANISAGMGIETYILAKGVLKEVS